MVFERVAVENDWFDVRRVADGVFALMEPNQFQEVISFLIIGEEQALLFDTGLGMSPICPVIEQLTALPVTVLNSHTHFDHIGGNAEFDHILAFNSSYTTANQRGLPGFTGSELARLKKWVQFSSRHAVLNLVAAECFSSSRRCGMK